MNVVAKVKCRCKTWIRIRAHSIPTDHVFCWKCGAEVWISWVSRSGGTGKILWQNNEQTTSNVQIESIELP